MNELTEPVVWRGRQWAITGYGLETISHPVYYIEWDRMGAVGNNYTWRDHMAEKGWCDMADFDEAFRLAAMIKAARFVDGRLTLERGAA